MAKPKPGGRRPRRQRPGEYAGRPGRDGAPAREGTGAPAYACGHAQMCTTGQVSVRVMPGTAWMRATTSLPSSSTDFASARTMTS